MCMCEGAGELVMKGIDKENALKENMTMPHLGAYLERRHREKDKAKGSKKFSCL